MSGTDRYRTIARDGAAEVEVKRSRFRCRLARVETEEAARAVVEEARRTYWDARHHCSAFRLGPRGEVQRSSDDGEPSGTAGAPMLDVLARRDVSDVVAVVTRWFGGTLLGTGGLVRAYSDAVAAALDHVGTRERRLMRRLQARVGHDTAGRLEGTVRNAAITVHGVEYRSDHAILSLAVPTESVERALADLAAWSAGSADAELGELEWVDA
ncbi:YigZ family protein [Phytoactinopolyspora alkaliphila]|uniref:YigZ family protein n=1 Tax=Phytoactinopolyspora alkaliphila TaxID=1783498 RepID=A0A6N9YIM5_9ACTN|nr:YigZ family protein [Phytoactinopolyspora alkaliphila]NED94719.1 YigZ family protein [Phytoactinopolyspora alkaliphila]